MAMARRPRAMPVGDDGSQSKQCLAPLKPGPAPIGLVLSQYLSAVRVA
jgi:hypothetical protein